MRSRCDRSSPRRPMSDDARARARAAPPGPPTAGRAGTSRTVQRAATDPQRRADARARRAGRAPVIERPMGRLPGGRHRHPVRGDLLVLRAGAARVHASRGSNSETNAQQVTAVERGYNLFQANCARCHGANGEGGDRSGPQPPGQAVRPSLGRLHRDDARGRWPLRLRQPELGHAGLVEPGTSARSAQLRPDRGSDRLHPGAQRPDLHGPGRDAERAEDRPGDRQGRDVQGLARRQLQAGARRDTVPGMLDRRVQDGIGGSVGGSPAHRRVRRVRERRRRRRARRRARTRRSCRSSPRGSSSRRPS